MVEYTSGWVRDETGMKDWPDIIQLDIKKKKLELYSIIYNYNYIEIFYQFYVFPTLHLKIKI